MESGAAPNIIRALGGFPFFNFNFVVNSFLKLTYFECQVFNFLFHKNNSLFFDGHGSVLFSRMRARVSSSENESGVNNKCTSPLSLVALLTTYQIDLQSHKNLKTQLHKQ